MIGKIVNEDMSVSVSERVCSSMKNIMYDSMKYSVKKCSEKYGFDAEVAMRELGLDGGGGGGIVVEKEEKKSKKEKKYKNGKIEILCSK